jgi:hypothetical protein
MTTKLPDDYYTSQRERLLRSFDRVSKRLNEVLAQNLDLPTPRGIIENTRTGFERLLPEIPYIGGKANGLTQDLIDCAMLLAFYRVLEEEGFHIEEIGRVVIAAEQERVHAYPRFFLRLLGRLIHSPIGKSHMKKTAEKSQRRRYPGDWVSVYLEGDGEAFDFGLDYMECGLCKFFHQQGADELTPYLCQFDFVQQRAMNTGFTRTMTLAEGGDRCDFRWMRGRETKSGWPPPWLV